MRIIALLATSSTLITAKSLFSEEIVSQIYARTSTWKPYDSDKNPFRNKSEQEI